MTTSPRPDPAAKGWSRKNWNAANARLANKPFDNIFKDDTMTTIETDPAILAATGFNDLYGLPTWAHRKLESIIREQYADLTRKAQAADKLAEALQVFVDKFNCAEDGRLGIGLVNGDFFKAIEALENFRATLPAPAVTESE